MATLSDNLNHIEIVISTSVRLSPRQFHFPPAYWENIKTGVHNELNREWVARLLDYLGMQRKYDQFQSVEQSN